jgi:hypothetical protein
MNNEHMATVSIELPPTPPRMCLPRTFGSDADPVQDLVSGTASTKPQPTSFLDLPLELRREAYHYTLVREEVIDVCKTEGAEQSAFAVKEMSLLLVCRQIHSEAADFLYGENMFKYRVDAAHGFQVSTFGSVNIARIRKLCIVMPDYEFNWEYYIRPWFPGTGHHYSRS